MSGGVQVKLEESWRNVLADEFSKPYFLALKSFLLREKEQGYKIFPPGSQIFAALDDTPFNTVKIVLLGQDPYHGPGQAHGLCFSVRPGVRVPESLKNIYRELHADLGIPPVRHGYLAAWAKRGVLLLNAVLTVRARTPNSHANKG